MSKKQVVNIHSHFHIFRDIHAPQEGDVTPAEEIKALERFVRWHERQLHVGKLMLEKLKRAQETPTEDVAAPVGDLTQQPSVG